MPTSTAKSKIFVLRRYCHSFPPLWDETAEWQKVIKIGNKATDKLVFIETRAGGYYELENVPLDAALRGEHLVSWGKLTESFAGIKIQEQIERIGKRLQPLVNPLAGDEYVLKSVASLVLLAQKYATAQILFLAPHNLACKQLMVVREVLTSLGIPKSRSKICKVDGGKFTSSGSNYASHCAESGER